MAAPSKIKDTFIQRSWKVWAGLLVLSLLIVYKIVRFQTTEKEELMSQVRDTQMKERVIEAKRGNIYASDGVSILATSTPEYKMVLDPTVARPELFKNQISRLSEKLAAYFKDNSAAAYKEKIVNARHAGLRYMVLNNKRLTYKEKAELETFPLFDIGPARGGGFFEEKEIRFHPYHSLAERTIGNLDKKDIRKGATGLEAEFDTYLKGVDGKGFYERLPGGYMKPVDLESDIASTPGLDVVTTLDVNFQDIAESALRAQVSKTQARYGSVVLMETETGEVKAIANLTRHTDADGQVYFSDDINYAVTGGTDPGSTFKLVQAAIGLGDGVITTSTSLSGNSKFSMHSAGETANLLMAIMKSSNPYFDNVLRRILHNDPKTGRAIPVDEGMKLWDEQIMRFGFGRQLGIDLPYETKGLIPTPERYDKIYGKKQWKYSTIYSISIGEGEYGVNVLKLANMASVFANRGYWITPHIVRSTGLDVSKGKNTPTEITKTNIDKRHFEEVVRGMEMVVQSGTGRAAQISGVDVCGKTGTSQNAKGKDHAIFIAFAPKHNPKIAIAVVVENGTFGGRASAPIAGLLMEKYLKGSHNREAYKESIMNTRYTTVAGGKSPREVEE